MKFTIKREKHNDTEWHKWFAWRPIFLKDIVNDDYTFVWLQYIERRQTYICDWDEGWWTWEYKT